MRRGADRPREDLGHQVLDWLADQQLVLAPWQARFVLDMYGRCEGPETVADAVAGT